MTDVAFVEVKPMGVSAVCFWGTSKLKTFS
jgi:hypothetical protein